MTWLSQSLTWIALGRLVVVLLWRSQAMYSRGGEDIGTMYSTPDTNSSPVAGNRIDPTHAVTADFEGKTFYFESE